VTKKHAALECMAPIEFEKAALVSRKLYSFFLGEDQYAHHESEKIEILQIETVDRKTRKAAYSVILSRKRLRNFN
jgi:hypothetical protein